jgi:hypothetical protein
MIGTMVSSSALSPELEKRDQHVVAGDHAEVAMAGLGRMDEVGRGAGAGQGRGDLAPDMAGLAHAADDDAPAAIEDQPSACRNSSPMRSASASDRIGLDAQNLPGKIERFRARAVFGS